MNLMEFTIIAPWACLLIYTAVFIITLFIMLNIDFGKVFKKEMRTQTMGLLLTVIVSLVVTFCIGTLLIVVSSLFVNIV